MRATRAVALTLATLALVVFLGGCGRGNSASELAAQDKAIRLDNQLASVHRRVAQAQRLVAKQRRKFASPPRPRASAGSPVQVVRTTDSSLPSLCSPATPSGNSKAARRLRAQQERARRQALYALNLSCPRTRS